MMGLSDYDQLALLPRSGRDEATGTDKWVDPETGHFIPRPIRVRGNSKNQRNRVDPVYGCTGGLTNQGHECPWGCYAL
ncbi:hypothetical protein EU546_05145, partial [Candidatus Thorarchaeota archaeon]